MIIGNQIERHNASKPFHFEYDCDICFYLLWAKQAPVNIYFIVGDAISTKGIPT